MKSIKKKTPKLVSISSKFAEKISSKIGLVKKDVTMFPPSATQWQIRNQVYGAKYSNLLFKTAKDLIENDVDNEWYFLAVQMGCKFE